VQKVKEIVASTVTSELAVGDNHGWTALHEACLYGNAECAALVTKALGARALLVSAGEDEATPLHEAVGNGHTSVLTAVLAALPSGNDITAVLDDTRDKSGLTVAEAASMNGGLMAKTVKEARLFHQEVTDLPVASLLPAQAICLHYSIVKYVGVFSLNFIKEDLKAMKRTANEGEEYFVRKFNVGLDLSVCPGPGVNYEVHRKDADAAADYREWNALPASCRQCPGGDLKALLSSVVRKAVELRSDCV